MAKVTVMGLDVVTEGSGHQCVGMAVSVCLTPPAPPPPGPGFMPIPYPLTGMVSEGIDDPPMRTKMMGDIILTVGSQMKLCHGNEAGTMNEVVSLTITKRCAPIVAAVLVWTELGMTGMTGAFGLMNINPAAGAGGSASDASGDAGGGGGGGGGGGAGSGGPSGPGAPPAGGGTGGGGSGAGGGAGSGGGRQNDNPNAAPGGASSPQDRHVCQNGHPVDVATGYVIDQQVDFHLPGLIPVRWKRYYSSARHRDHDATLGAGWAHGFEQRLDDHERVLTLRDEEGREVWFDRVAVGQRSFHRRDRLELLRVKEDEYTVTSIETRQIRRFRALRPEGACLLVSIEDAYGNAVRLTYEGERLASITDTTGRIVNVRWRDGRIASVSVTARGQRQLVVTYAYTKRGCLSHVVDPAGYSDFFEYDERNRMVAATIKNGTRFTYDYDPRTGRCARTGGPNGLYECAFERNAAKGITVSRGEETRIFHWNELGLVTKEYLPDGSLLQENAYDADGVLVAAANGAGEGTQIYHDHRGNPLRVRDPAGRETLSVYHDDRLQRLSLPDGEVREFAYNPQGDLIAVRSNRGRWVSFAYDARGRMIDARDESGGYFGRVYDEENNLVRETDARGAHTHYRYDALGRAVGMADALGAVTQASFDARGARTSLRTPDGASWRWSYDAMGAVAKETDPLGHTTHFENAGMGFPVAVHTPDGRTWKLGYTSRERLASVENPLGEVYTFQYDDGGRVITEQTFDGRTLRYAYDAAERISGVTYPDETSRGFEYDRLGHLVVDRGSDGSTVTLRRDVHGRLREALQTEGEAQTVTDHTRLDRNEDGFLTAVHRGDTSIHFQHDVRGRVVARELPGGIITRYAHAPTGELIGLEHAGETVTFGRDLLGREVRRGLRATVVESRYDAMDRLIEQRVSAPKPGEGLPEGMSALVSRRWSYDRKGRLTRIEDGRWGETTYGYGPLDELVSAQRGDVREAFRYDGAHSITAMTTHRGESVTQALPPSLHKTRADRLKKDDWEVGPGNQLIRTEKDNYVYDRRGRRVEKHTRTTDGSAALTRYEWDLRDRLRAVHRPDGKIVKIAYDAFGRRTEKLIVSAETGDVESGTRLLWDGDVVCADSETTRGTRTWAHQGFEPVVQTQNGVSYLVICDQVGTPKELIDGYGRVAWAAAHSAWGTVTEERGDTAEGAAPITCPFRLLGQYFDEETGLAATRYRYWDAEVGRWLSEDPLGIGGGLNLFGFDASPTGWVDPLGLATESGDGHGVKLTGKGKEVLRDPALQAMKDKTVAEAIKERGGGAGQVQQVASDLREARLGDVANQAATGDADAVTAIKMVKQASSKKQKYGGK